MKNIAYITFVFALMLSLAPDRAAAQNVFALGGHFGINMDQDVTFIGAQARIGVGNLPVRIQPGFDYGLNENDQYYRLEGNALYYLGEEFTTTFTPYIGPGLALKFSDTEDEDNDVDLGISAVGGIEFRPFLGGISPYLQARYTFSPGADPLEVMGGLLFRF